MIENSSKRATCINSYHIRFFTLASQPQLPLHLAEDRGDLVDGDRAVEVADRVPPGLRTLSLNLSSVADSELDRILV